MSAYDQLTWFTIAMMVLWIGTILIPYLNGKAHLFSIWNFFLVGSLVFVGLANLALTQRWEEPLFQYTAAEIQSLMLGLTIFYVTVYAVYYLIPMKRVAGSTFLTWPKMTRKILVFFAIVCIGSTMFFYLPIKIPVVSQLARQFALKSIGFGVALIFVAWFRDRKNPFLNTLLIGFVLYGLLFSITVGGGRRTFIVAVSGIPLGIYWLHYRKQSKLKTIGFYSVAAIGLVILLVGYGTLRHRSRAGGDQRSFSYALESLQMLPSRFMKGDGRQLLGQRATEFSMLARRAYRNRPEPFALGKYILTNPIPRQLWPEKPYGLGYVLPKLMTSRTRATWGPGVVGHAFHEGNLYFLILYGGLFALFVRFGDELLARQPENPILIGTLVSIFPHVIGWVRGDCGTFSIQIIAGVMTAGFVYVLIWFYGRGITARANKTDHLSMGQVISNDRKGAGNNLVGLAYYNLENQPSSQNFHRYQ